jgi:MFS family permease
MARPLPYQLLRQDNAILLAPETVASLDLSDTELTSSQRSLHALDWLNFFKADAQTTVGPCLAIFLLSARHWNLASIGIAMSVPGFVSIVAQTPAGALVDWITRKRALVALAASALGAACLIVVNVNGLAAVAFAQGIIAMASIVMPPAIAALTVGLVGHRITRWLVKRKWGLVGDLASCRFAN